MILTIICATFSSSNCQRIEYNFSSKKDGFRGKVKSATLYALEFNPLGLDKVDSLMGEKGEIQFTKFYNDKGLLYRLESTNEKNVRNVKLYKYDNTGNILSVYTKDFGYGITKKDTFKYDHEKMVLTQEMNTIENIPISGEIRGIAKKKYYFDDSIRQVKVEYIDTNQMALITVLSYYDEKSNLIQSEIFEGAKLKSRYFQTFDLMGRKKIIQTIDLNGNFTTKKVYSWIDDHTMYFDIYDAEGNIEFKSKEVLINDTYGNTIKKYYFNLSENSGTIYRYNIVYY